MKLLYLKTTVDFLDEETGDNWRVVFKETSRKTYYEGSIFKNNKYMVVLSAGCGKPSKVRAIEMIEKCIIRINNGIPETENLKHFL